MAPNPFSNVRAVAAAVGVGLLALVAGVAIAGLPSSVPNDVVIGDINAVTTTSSVVVAAPPDSTAQAQVTSDVDGIRNGEAAEDERPATAPRATTTVAPTAPASSVVTGPALVAEPQLRVVVANAGGRDGLAARYTELVVGMGYASVEPANATDRRDVSVVYWSPGREGEARRLAEQLGVTVVEPMPGERFVLGNFVADLWAIIGRDLEDR